MDSTPPRGAMPRRLVAAAVLACAAALPGGAPAAAGPRLPVTEAQRATASQVAQAGVPLSALAPDAPPSHTVRRGDTLWAISGLFLRSPWRWPELWGMNLQEIGNPHLIYPGQVLYLDTTDGRARLSLVPPDGGLPQVRLSPRIRAEAAPDPALPTLAPHAIEPFLSESLIVDAQTLAAAPRIVAPQDDRVLLGVGDRAYARAPDPRLLAMPDGQPRRFRIFRDARAIRHPETRQVLGHEARFVGVADLVREGSEGREDPGSAAAGQPVGERLPVPATFIVRSARQEVLAGDRLLPEPEPAFPSYAPHAPREPDFAATIVAMPDDAVAMAGQRQIVVIDKGRADGVDTGLVLGVLSRGRRVVDRTAPPRGERIQLPGERQGVLMVFRAFERLSYALILEIQSPVALGDRVGHP